MRATVISFSSANDVDISVLWLHESLLLSLYHKIISYNLCYLSTADKVMNRISFQASEFAKPCCDIVAKESLGEMLFYQSTFFPTPYSLVLVTCTEETNSLIFDSLNLREWVLLGVPASRIIPQSCASPAASSH